MTIIDPPIKDNSLYYIKQLYQNTANSPEKKEHDSLIGLCDKEVHHVEELAAATETIPPVNFEEDEDDLKHYSIKVREVIERS